MPVRLALCDLGAPSGEPWFPHSAVLFYLTTQGMAMLVMLCFGSAFGFPPYQYRG